jgi:hypothetical protein
MRPRGAAVVVAVIVALAAVAPAGATDSGFDVVDREGFEDLPLVDSVQLEFDIGGGRKDTENFVRAEFDGTIPSTQVGEGRMAGAFEFEPAGQDGVVLRASGELTSSGVIRHFPTLATLQLDPAAGPVRVRFTGTYSYAARWEYLGVGFAIFDADGERRGPWVEPNPQEPGASGPPVLGSGTFDFTGEIQPGEGMQLGFVLRTGGGGSQELTYDFELLIGEGCTLTGTPRADVLVGTEGDDVICGLGGADVIRGLGGNDTIYGGGGNDVIEGGDGADTIYGGKGNDEISAGDDASNDMVEGGPGNDTIYGPASGAGNLFGDGGRDLLVGGGANDLLVGGPGGDYLFGGGGRDVIDGGEGDDWIFGGPGNDVLDGHGIGGPDDGADDLIFGCGDADTIDGGAGNDDLYGGEALRSDAEIAAGLETLGFELAARYVQCEAVDGAGDRVFGGPGDDELYGQRGRDYLRGGSGSDKLNGGPGNDNLAGNTRFDIHIGGPGNDTILANDGARDEVRGGPGQDEARYDDLDTVTGVETRLGVR